MAVCYTGCKFEDALGQSNFNVRFVRKGGTDDVEPIKRWIMGKIKPDLAGAFINKLGAVAYYVKDGVNYARTLSKGKYTSNTPQQAVVKAKFRTASKIAGQVKEVAKVGFPQRGRGITPKNAWHSANKDCFRITDDRVEVDFEEFQFSDGALYPATATLTYEQESRTYTVNYSEMPEESNCHPDDIVYVVLLDTKQLFTRLVSLGKRGEPGETSIMVSELWSDAVMAYCFATTADGKVASRTQHLEIE